MPNQEQIQESIRRIQDIYQGLPFDEIYPNSVPYTKETRHEWLDEGSRLSRRFRDDLRVYLGAYWQMIAEAEASPRAFRVDRLMTIAVERYGDQPRDMIIFAEELAELF